MILSQRQQILATKLAKQRKLMTTYILVVGKVKTQHARNVRASLQDTIDRRATLVCADDLNEAREALLSGESFTARALDKNTEIQVDAHEVRGLFVDDETSSDSSGIIEALKTTRQFELLDARFVIGHRGQLRQL